MAARLLESMVSWDLGSSTKAATTKSCRFCCLVVFGALLTSRQKSSAKGSSRLLVGAWQRTADCTARRHHHSQQACPRSYSPHIHACEACAVLVSRKTMQWPTESRPATFQTGPSTKTVDVQLVRAPRKTPSRSQIKYMPCAHADKYTGAGACLQT